MKKILVVAILFISSSLVYAADLNITAAGWDNYGSILRLLTYNKQGIDEKILNDIVNKISQDCTNDEFEVERIKSLRFEIYSKLKNIIQKQEFPSDQIIYRMNSFRDNWVKYDFSTKRLCFDQVSNSSVNMPWQGMEYKWRIELNSEINLDKKLMKKDWSTGFDANIYNKDGSTYCIKVENQDKAKELKSLFDYKSAIKPAAIIDAKIIDLKITYRFGEPRINALTKAMNVKIINSYTNETLYETTDVIAN